MLPKVFLIILYHWPRVFQILHYSYLDTYIYNILADVVLYYPIVTSGANILPNTVCMADYNSFCWSFSNSKFILFAYTQGQIQSYIQLFTILQDIMMLDSVYICDKHTLPDKVSINKFTFHSWFRSIEAMRLLGY